MLEDEVEGQVYYIAKVEQHKALKRLNYHRGQGDGSVVMKSCRPCFLGTEMM